MSSQRAILFLCAIGLSATLADALPQVMEFPTDPGSYTLPFGYQFTTELFRKTVAADFDGDGLDDVVAQRGTGLEEIFGPASIGTYLGPFGNANGATVKDFALLPGAGPTGRPSVITVGSDGLEKRSWDPSLPSFWNHTNLATTQWLNAERVAVPATPTPPVMIFGVKADHRTVLCFDLGSGQTIVFPTAAADITELQALQFDSDSVPEVAIVSGGWLEVHSIAGPGSLVRRSSLGYTSNALAPVRLTPSEPEQLLWFITGPGNVNEYLGTLGLLSEVNQGKVMPQPAPYYPPLPGVVACTRADLDGDGRDDIVYSQTYQQSLVVLYDSLPAPTVFKQQLTTSRFEPISYGTGSASTNRAQPACADIDNNGKLDVCFPVQSTSELFVHLSTPEINTAPYLTSDTPPVLGSGTIDNGTFLLTLHIATAPPTGADRLEVCVLRRSSLSVPIEPLYDVQHFPSTGTLADTLDGEGTAHFDLGVRLAEETQTVFDAVYFLLLRWVSSDGASVAPRFTPRLYGFQFSGDQAHLDYIAHNQYSKGPVSYLTFGIGQLGTICEFTRLPDLPPDNPVRPH